jgi:di- and tripeptidase
MSRWRYPAFTVHRVDVSGPSNTAVIPKSAIAAMSMRIVPDQNITKICREFEDYVLTLFNKLETDCTIEVSMDR